MAIVVATHPGEQACWHAVDRLKKILGRQSLAHVIFATGASQFGLLERLAESQEIDWRRVAGWHLDEYLNLPEQHPASFRRYLRDRLVDRVDFHSFQFIDGNARDPQLECQRLGALIQDVTIDLALIGIGENAHIAFNDPPADWNATEAFQIVELDQACRQQQLGEGWFADLASVPQRAITMTCRQILKSREIICTVPDDRKAFAVQKTLCESPTPVVPASCLQSHPRVTLFLDERSASQLPLPQQSAHPWFKSQTLLPCRCFDLQINGYLGVDFNSDSLTGEDLLSTCQTLEQQGVSGILLTLITDDLAAMCRQIEHIGRLRQQHEFLLDFIPGLHLEGPFISSEPGYCGAHPADCTLDATIDRMASLLEAADGLVRWVTLAPERDPQASVTRYLTDQNIVVAAGHTNASLAQLQRAVDCGLSVFTHLGNACPAEMPRHDNIIQRALSLRDQLRYTIIADGVHVPEFVWRWWLNWLGPERVMLISDATAAAGCGPGQYRLGRQTITVDSEARSQFNQKSGLLAGSTQGLPSIIGRLFRSESGVASSTLETISLRNAQAILSSSPRS